MPNYTKFKAVENISDPQLSEQLKVNLINFFNWGFLEIGGFYNIEIPTSGIYGGDFHVLKPVQNPYYTTGQIWQGVHDDWIYETGIERADQPINISGIFVDDVFYPTSTSGSYEYYIDYPNGQVVFTNAINTSSEVKLEYSFRGVSVIDADSLPFQQRFQGNMYRPDNERFSQVGSGDWDTMRETSVGLPCVGIDLQKSNSTPYSIGGSNKIQNIKANFHVYSETPNWANKISEILESQEYGTIYLFDLNRMIDDSVYMLDYRGTTTSGTMMYPDLIKSSGDGGYRWKTMRFKECNTQFEKKIHQNLYHASVNAELEVVMRNT